MQKKDIDEINRIGKETNWGENLSDIDSSSLGLDDGSIEAQAAEYFAEEDLRVIKRICYYLSSVGLTLEESCLLVSADPVKFRKMMDETPLLGKIVEYKELQYKKDLLRTLSAKARGGDDKLSQWLLERKFSQEYGKKAPNSSPKGEDPLDQALDFIRKSGNSLVNPGAGKPATPAPTSVSAGVLKKIKDILK